MFVPLVTFSFPFTITDQAVGDRTSEGDVRLMI